MNPVMRSAGPTFVAGSLLAVAFVAGTVVASDTDSGSGKAGVGGAAMSWTPESKGASTSSLGDAALARLFNAAGGLAPNSQALENLPYNGDFTFVRIRFSSGGGGFGGGFGRGGAPWAHDFPYADNNFVKILDEVTGLDPNVNGSNVIDADDPDLMRYPIAYLSEPGRWSPTRGDVDNLEAYLKKGGFLILDDFRGEREWARVEAIFNAILPELRFSELDLENPIFHSFFDVESLDFRPPTFQQYQPRFMGIYEDNDPSKRLMVIANFNNDIGDYWEYSDMGYYPVDLSNEAYKVGVNYVIYALTR